MILKIQNLNVSTYDNGNKKILENINLEFEKGKIYVLMGPNGSGKTTLANVLMGDSKYKIDTGKIFFETNSVMNNITKTKPNERAKKGIFLSFQNPVEIPGVNLSSFLRTSYNSIKKNKKSIMEFQEFLNAKANSLRINSELLKRDINKGFSGGEKKKMEILQLSVLEPKFAILDEIDSGLDIDSLRFITKKIKELASKDKTILIITHYKRILNYLDPDKIFVLKNGKIVLQGKKDIADYLEEKGYTNLENN